MNITSPEIPQGEHQPKEVIHTPEGASEALERAFKGYFHPIFVQAELQRVHRELPHYYERLIGERLPFAETPANNASLYQQATDKLTAAAQEWQESWRAIRPDHITSVLAMTQSPFKRSTLTVLGRTADLEIDFPTPQEVIDEERLHQQMVTFNKEQDWYSWTLTRNKTLPNPVAFQRPLVKPRIGLDTTVWADDRLFEKPKTIVETYDALTYISGKPIMIMTTANLALTTFSGEPLNWPGGISIQPHIRHLSAEDKHRYTETQQIRDAYKQTNAGLDFTTTHGLGLIDEKKPIKIMPLGFGLVPSGHLRFNFSTYPEERAFYIAKPAFSALQTSLKGIPKQLVADVMRNIKTVYRQF